MRRGFEFTFHGSHLNGSRSQNAQNMVSRLFNRIDIHILVIRSIVVQKRGKQG